MNGSRDQRRRGPINMLRRVVWDLTPWGTRHIQAREKDAKAADIIQRAEDVHAEALEALRQSEIVRGMRGFEDGVRVRRKTVKP